MLDINNSSLLTAFGLVVILTWIAGVTSVYAAKALRRRQMHKLYLEARIPARRIFRK